MSVINGAFKTMKEATNKLTNDEFFEGVRRRVPGTANARCKGRYSPEFVDLIRIYFLTDGERSLNKTAKYFNEQHSSLLGPLKGLYQKDPNKKVIRRTKAELEKARAPVVSQIETEIVRLLKAYAEAVRKQFIDELIAKGGVNG